MKFKHIVGSGALAREICAYSNLPKVSHTEQFYADCDYVLAIGSPLFKKKIDEENPHVSWFNYISPDAKVLSFFTDKGIIICPKTVVTVGVAIGKHVTINLNCTIGHDCKIGAYTTIHPGCNISGNVTIGECCEIGTNTCIIPGVKIGNNVVIGAGSVIIRDVPDDCTVVGNPGKIIKSKLT